MTAPLTTPGRRPVTTVPLEKTSPFPTTAPTPTTEEITMTTTATTTTYQPWCGDCRGNDCSGEHQSQIKAVPATGSDLIQHLIDKHWTEALVPLASVRTVFGEEQDDAPSVSLFVSGLAGEAEINLRPHEARRLISLLEESLNSIT